MTPDTDLDALLKVLDNWPEQIAEESAAAIRALRAELKLQEKATEAVVLSSNALSAEPERVTVAHDLYGFQLKERTAERDELRAEVEVLKSCHANATDDLEDAQKVSDALKIERDAAQNILRALVELYKDDTIEHMDPKSTAEWFRINMEAERIIAASGGGEGEK